MSRERVLIVDDTPEGRYLLRTLLQGNGYQVEEACHGEEALRKARENPPDLVISDILMPVMDGFSLCRVWTRDPLLSRIPFVFYTATYTEEEDRELGLSLGASAFIVKPQEPEVFVELVREALRGVHADAGARPACEIPTNHDYLVQYNQALVRKLEQKIEQLEATRKRLEEEIAAHEKTERELRERVEELQRWQEALLDREDRIIELKREVNELLAAAGLPPRYPSALAGGQEHVSA